MDSQVSPTIEGYIAMPGPYETWVSVTWTIEGGQQVGPTIKGYIVCLGSTKPGCDIVNLGSVCIGGSWVIEVSDTW